MIPQEITRDHILDALKEIDAQGVPENRESTQWFLKHDEKLYPPKYVISISGKYALGHEHSHEPFSGGPETNTFLESRGFAIVPKNQGDWNERECYFAVWGYDQLDQDRDIVKTHLYEEIVTIIGRTSKAIEWKIQNVPACDPRPRSEKPISEAPNKQSLLEQVFINYWLDRAAARAKYPLYLQEAQFGTPSSTEKTNRYKEIIIEEGAPGFQESFRRKRSATLLVKGREHYRNQDADKQLRCKACGFSTPVGLFKEIIQLHHTVPIAESGDEGRKFSIEDALRLLLPLCPTCHQLAHSSSPPLELAEIKSLRDMVCY